MKRRDGGVLKSSYHAIVWLSHGQPQSGTCLSAGWWAPTCPQAHRGFRPGGESHLGTSPGGQAPLTAIYILVGCSDASSRAIWIWLAINDIHKWAERRPFVWFYLGAPLVSGPVWLDGEKTLFFFYLCSTWGAPNVDIVAPQKEYDGGGVTSG